MTDLQPWECLMKRIVWKQLGDIRDKKILDFGSGIGVTANYLAEYNDVTAIEPDEDCVKERWADNQYTQIIGSTDELRRFADESFDMIICHNVLEYAQDREDIVKQFARVLKTDGKISIVRDVDGKNIVIINDIRFRGKRKIKWDEVEKYLREYVKKYYEIEAYSDKIYIGKDFPDEFAHSRDSEKLSGANAKAKANAAQAIGELIRTATNKSMSEDHENKHGTRAQNGWYRYDVRFGIPVYDQNEDLERYNIYTAKMLVRHDADGKLYLYDIIRTKKETSTPSGLL